MNFDELIKNLNTLNEIKIYDKLSIKNNLLYIDKYSLCRPLLRNIYKQNREAFYIFLIKFIDEVIIHLDYYIEYKNLKKNSTVKKLPIIKNFTNYSNVH